MSELPNRGIIREHEFEEQLAALIPSGEDADEFVAAAETVLAENPLIGMPASSDGTIWQLSMPPIRGKAVSLYYAFNAREVYLLAIVAFEE